MDMQLFTTKNMLSDHLINIVLSYGEVGRRRELAEDFNSIVALMTNKPAKKESVNLSMKEWKEAMLRFNICNKQTLYEQISLLSR